MATRQSFAFEIVARARRIGWEVRIAPKYGWNIICPDGTKVQVHRTPSDVNAPNALMAQLNNHGFGEAEEEWKKLDEEKRQSKLSADRKKAQAALDKAQQHADALSRASGQTRVNLEVLLNPYPVPKTIERVVVDPVLAGKLLDLNTENRPIRQREVRLWNNILEHGEWQYTHQGIAIDNRGVLQDGQHRLTAIVQTGIPAEMQISIGMPPENFAAIDNGLRRTFGDVVARRGIAQAPRVGSAARIIALYNDYPKRPWSAKVSNAEVDMLISAELPNGEGTVGEQIYEASQAAYALWRQMGINRTAATVGIYVLWELFGKDDQNVQTFLEGMHTPEFMSGKDARFVLRRYCLSPVKRDRSAITHLALFIKTWNKFIQGQDVEQLSFRKNEDMPKPIVPSE